MDHRAGKSKFESSWVGVSFIDDKAYVKDKIEKLVIDMIHSADRTYTM